MINKSDSRRVVVRFCYHSCDYRPNWTQLSPITITNQGRGKCYVVQSCWKTKLKRKQNLEFNSECSRKTVKRKTKRKRNWKLGLLSLALKCIVSHRMNVLTLQLSLFTASLYNIHYGTTLTSTTKKPVNFECIFSPWTALFPFFFNIRQSI